MCCEPSDNAICPHLPELRGIWFKINLRNLRFCFDGRQLLKLLCLLLTRVGLARGIWAEEFSINRVRESRVPFFEKRLTCLTFVFFSLCYYFSHFSPFPPVYSRFRPPFAYIYNSSSIAFWFRTRLPYLDTRICGKFINILNRLTQPLISLAPALFCSSIATAISIHRHRRKNQTE